MSNIHDDEVGLDEDDEAAAMAEAEAEFQQQYASYVMEAQDFLYRLTGRAMEEEGVTSGWHLAWLAMCEAICDVIVDDQTGINREGESADIWRNGYRRDLIDGLVGSLFENAEVHGDPPPLIDNQHMTVICKPGGGVGLVVPEFDVGALSRALGHYADAMGSRTDEVSKADLRAVKRIEVAVGAAQQRLAERLGAEAELRKRLGE